MFTHPMKKGTFTRTSGYGPRSGSMHRGVDYAAPIGTPVYAPADGIVVEGSDRAQGSVSGFGSWIWIDAQDSCGKDFIFGHVHHPGIKVRRGDRVKAGQQIGVVGNEGQSTGPHLHFEVWGPPGRVGGTSMDPEAWLRRAGAIEPGTRTLPAPAGSGTVSLGGIQPWKPDHVLLSPNTSGRRSLANLLWLILHTDESAYDYSARRVRDTGWSALRLAKFQQNRSAGGSYTGAGDQKGLTCRIAQDGSITWSTGNDANVLALNFCLAGTTAHFTRAQWLARMEQLRSAAHVMAWWAHQYQIPIRKLQPGDMRARRKGIGGHDDARELGSTTHWDPGPHFPWDIFIPLIKEAGAGMDEKKLRAIVAEEVDKLFAERKHQSLVEGSTRKMSGWELLRLIDLHVHETRKIVAALAKKVEQIIEAKETTK